MGNCESKKDDCLFVVNAIRGEAENGFAECTSSNCPDILPVEEVNILIKGVNSAIKATKCQKKYIRLNNQYLLWGLLMLVSYFITGICAVISAFWSWACKNFKSNFLCE